MLKALFAAGMLFALAAAPAEAAGAKAYDPWPDLVTDVFDGRPIEDGAGVLSLETPYRAEDAALVPVTIRSELAPGSGLTMKRLTLIIDNNPSPVAAEFDFGPGGTVREISTRVRVDAYTNVHAVAELSDGKLYSVANFVKAAGGCSAPGAKVAGAQEAIGDMRLRWFDAAASGGTGPLEAQLMIRHPNNSGLQMDQVTMYYIPAWFVRDIKVNVGDDLLFRMQGGISISENPTFRFTYDGDAGEAVTVEAIDTKDKVFRGSWPGPAADAS